MEKWKVGLILAIIAAFGSFQYISSTSRNTPGQPSGEQPSGTPVATATPDPALLALEGKTPTTWNIAANLWINTPKPITPAELKGSVTLLEFWRSECSHCQDAIPFMNMLHKSGRERGLRVVTFQSPGVLNATNPENNWKAVQAFARKNGITYPVAFDTGRKLKDSYKVQWYPLILLIDRQGRIQFAQTGHTKAKGQELMAKIQELLAKK